MMLASVEYCVMDSLTAVDTGDSWETA